MEHKLKVGFGRQDITPQEYMEMGGHANDKDRICTVILDRLYGTCIAVRDEAGETFLLCTLDFIHSYQGSVTKYTREAITAATGIPAERIMVSATHLHSGPSGAGSLPRVLTYMEYLGKQMASAATQALEDLAEAEIFIGHKTVDRMNFERHYITNDGQAFGAGLGSDESGLASHYDKADNQLQVIRFVRKDARDILLVNWQAHVTMVGSGKDTKMSADFVGAMRNHLEGLTGCHAAYYQGACGNLNPTSRISGEQLTENNDYMTYGKLLAEQAVDVMQNMQPVKSGPVRTRHMMYKAPIDHSEDHKVELAKEGMELYNANKAKNLPREELFKPLWDRGFSGRYHAAHVIHRFNAEPYKEVELNVLSAGDISFATAPYEMYASNGMFIKENTPFAMTFVLGYCNGSFNYIVDKKGFENFFYEVKCRRFPEGTAEALVQTHVDMLKEIKEA